MTSVKVDLEKSVKLGQKVCDFIHDYLEKTTMNAAEVLIALNEVAYRVSNATKIPPVSPALEPVNTDMA